MNNIETTLEKLLDKIILQLPNVAVALALLFFGRYAIGFILRFLNNRFERREVDMSIRGFVSSLLKVILYVLLILTAASTMGIATTSFIAALSAFGLAVGMALQGSLSNFAGGILILLFRPFEVGDYINSANGSSGTVEKIDLLYTTLTDDNGIKVFSPNGTLANSVIKNYTKITSRRFDIVVGIGYEDNIKVAKEIILKILNDEENILKNPAPTVFVGSLGDSSVNLTIRGWIPKENFWAINNGLQEKIKLAFDKNGISIPFPQTEMHIRNIPNE